VTSSSQPPPRADIAACILAGGRGSRLGGAVKPLLTIDGRTILDRLIEVLTPLTSDILIAVAVEGQVATSLRTVVDAVPSAGPLAGIGAALAAAERPWLIVVGGDMPYVHPGVLHHLLCRATTGVDAVAARIGGFPEPLCAVYGRSCQDAVRRRLAEGRFRTGGLLTDENLHIAWVEEGELRAIDEDLRTFRSINHPQDLARS
jgi:molybdopterin-guanine dinucleotide biosynthesis protein A